MAGACHLAARAGRNGQVFGGGTVEDGRRRKYRRRQTGADSSQDVSDTDSDCTRTPPSPPQAPTLDRADPDPLITLVQPPAPLPHWWPSWLGHGTISTRSASSCYSLEALRECGASVASSTSPPALFEGKVIRNRGRGDCLFMALAHDLPDALEHGTLRTLLMSFLRAKCNAKVGQHSFTALIQFQFMQTVAEYATYMGARSIWGGLVEILLFSRRFRRQVQVYVKHGNSFAFVYSVGSRALPATRIVYDGSHYEALMPAEEFVSVRQGRRTGDDTPTPPVSPTYDELTPPTPTTPRTRRKDDGTPTPPATPPSPRVRAQTPRRSTL